jgi:integrase/recombinase XerD
MSPRRPNLDLLLEEFLRSLRVRNFSRRTIAGLRWKLGKFMDFLDRQGIADVLAITREAISSYQVELYEKLNRKGSPNTVSYQNDMLSAVRQFMGFLKQHDYIVSDPSIDVPYAKAPKPLPRGVLTSSEARKVLHAPDTKSVIGYRDRTILEVLYSTGIRKEELNNLTISDVDYTDGFLRIENGKGGKDRIVPLGRIACRYLENYMKSVRPELLRDPYEKHLFLSGRYRKLSRNVVWELIKKYARKAKIHKNVHPHTFRHTCATGMLRNKANIRVVQELLGHSSLNSTQIYTHLSITDLKEVHARCHPREKDRE